MRGQRLDVFSGFSCPITIQFHFHDGSPSVPGDFKPPLLLTLNLSWSGNNCFVIVDGSSRLCHNTFFHDRNSIIPRPSSVPCSAGLPRHSRMVPASPIEHGKCFFLKRMSTSANPNAPCSVLYNEGFSVMALGDLRERRGSGAVGDVVDSETSSRSCGCL